MQLTSPKQNVADATHDAQHDNNALWAMYHQGSHEIANV